MYFIKQKKYVTLKKGEVVEIFKKGSLSNGSLIEKLRLIRKPKFKVKY